MSLIQKAVREVYYQNTFSIHNIPFDDIVKILKKQNISKVIIVADTKNLRAKIKKRVKYFLTHIKSERGQQNKNEDKVSFDGLAEKKIKRDGEQKPDDKVSLDDLTEEFFSILDESDRRNEDKISIEDLSEHFVTIYEGSDAEKFSFNFLEFDMTTSTEKCGNEDKCSENIIEVCAIIHLYSDGHIIKTIIVVKIMILKNIRKFLENVKACY